ncbi:MAG: hypothetical protein ACTHNZ_11935 [Trinickia sp.]|uniref:hypothetical protein n=1 Tax=Trinickia sp. TaxID=2571163 RepID=UPI003F817A1B
MKRPMLQFMIAIGLAAPMFLILTSIDPLLAWIHGDAGWKLLTPAFHAYGAVGVEGEDEVIAGLLLVGIFTLAISLVWFIWHVPTHRHVKTTAP